MGRGYRRCSLLAASCAREEETWEEELNVRKKRRKEKRKRKGRKIKERKRKKYGKKFKLENFWGEK
jgi:hypothetical protein